MIELICWIFAGIFLWVVLSFAWFFYQMGKKTATKRSRAAYVLENIFLAPVFALIYISMRLDPRHR